MAALSKVHPTTAYPVALINAYDKTIGRRMPRRCTVIAVGLILAGFAISLLMAVHVLPTTLWLGFVVLVLWAVGGARLLSGWGEI